MIFWKHIKGLNQSNGSNALYTWIDFATLTSGTATNPNTKTNMPILYLCNSATGTRTSCGYLITSGTAGQTIDKDFTFTENLDISKTLDVTGATTLYSTLDVTSIATFSSTVNCNSTTYLKGNTYLTSGKYFYLNGTTASAYLYYNSGCYLHSAGALYLESAGTSNGVYIRQGTTTRATFSSSGLSVTGYCYATYFNATSDRRAKTDIQPLLINALDLVRKIQLYSFKYKETGTPSIGIIAQDVQDIEIQGFKLVDNEEATGKDLDYMSIHESKLTYILWKAVQEQQKLIEDLQKEIKELKKN